MTLSVKLFLYNGSINKKILLRKVTFWRQNMAKCFCLDPEKASWLTLICTFIYINGWPKYPNTVVPVITPPTTQHVMSCPDKKPRPFSDSYSYSTINGSM